MGPTFGIMEGPKTAHWPAFTKEVAAWAARGMTYTTPLKTTRVDSPALSTSTP